jgi:hypothetical protein
MGKEEACMSEDIMMEKCDDDRDPKLDASMEVFSILAKMLDRFTWMGIQNMNPEQAESRQEIVKMKIAFIREAASLLEPALKYVENYMGVLISSDTVEDEAEGDD